MREKAKELYESGFGTLKALAEKLGVSENTLKSWKSRDKWVAPKKKVATKGSKVAQKKKKEMVKVLIEEGHSITEAAKQTGIPRGTIGRWSAEENLQQTQLENLKAFREEHRERIRRNKLLRLETNEEALMAINFEIGEWRGKGLISKAVMEKLLMNEEIEQLIFESDKIDRMEKLELEKSKVKEDEESNSKTMEAIDKLSKKIECDFNEG